MILKILHRAVIHLSFKNIDPYVIPRGGLTTNFGLGNETFNAYPPLPNDGTFSTFIESVIFGAIKIRNMGIGSQN